MGLAQAGSIRVSNAFGRNDWPKISIIGKSTLLTALAYGIFCAIGFALLRNVLPGAFNNNAEVFAMASTLTFICRHLPDIRRHPGYRRRLTARHKRCKYAHRTHSHSLLGRRAAFRLHPRVSFRHGRFGNVVGFYYRAYAGVHILNKPLLEDGLVSQNWRNSVTCCAPSR